MYVHVHVHVVCLSWSIHMLKRFAVAGKSSQPSHYAWKKFWGGGAKHYICTLYILSWYIYVTYHRWLQVVSASVLLLNFIQGCLNFEQVLRVAGGVLVSDDQSRGGREALEIHRSTSLRLDGSTWALTYTNVHTYLNAYVAVTDRKRTLFLSCFDHLFFLLYNVITLSVSVPESSKLIFSNSYLSAKSIPNSDLKLQSILTGDLL